MAENLGGGGGMDRRVPGGGHRAAPGRSYSRWVTESWQGDDRANDRGLRGERGPEGVGKGQAEHQGQGR